MCPVATHQLHLAWLWQKHALWPVQLQNQKQHSSLTLLEYSSVLYTLASQITLFLITMFMSQGQANPKITTLYCLELVDLGVLTCLRERISSGFQSVMALILYSSHSLLINLARKLNIITLRVLSLINKPRLKIVVTLSQSFYQSLASTLLNISATTPLRSFLALTTSPFPPSALLILAIISVAN